MSQDDRDRWNARYRDGAYVYRTHPSRLVAEWAPRVLAQQQAISPADPARPPPRALDVACGGGRNALYLASLGYRADGVDVAEAAIERARATAERLELAANFAVHDLDQPLPERDRDYDLIIVIRYLDLALLPQLEQRLRPGGYLLCEVHLQTDRNVVGPSGPAFRAAPGALRAAVMGLEICYAWEGIVDDPDGRPAALAQLVARRPNA